MELDLYTPTAVHVFNGPRFVPAAQSVQWLTLDFPCGPCI